MQYNMIEKIEVRFNIHNWWIGFDWGSDPFNDCNFGIVYYCHLQINIIPCVSIYILIGPDCYKMKQKQAKQRKAYILVYQKKPPRDII